MNRLGISLYPNVSNNLIKDKEYLKLASEYGFTRLFMCLLNMGNQSKDYIIHQFTSICTYAKELGYEIIFDISPSVMNELAITYDDLELFSTIGASGIRLDESFGGTLEAHMTHNHQNLKIEINASVDDNLIEKIIKHKPNKQNLVTCHNYYPLKYTGLSLEHFMKTSKKMKKQDLIVTAFVSSQEKNSFGPWDVNEGLCTLEMHRELPIDIQVKHLLSTGVCDDILIANAYASLEELKACQEAITKPHSLHIYVYENSIIEDKIIDELHELRKDKSEYVIRSTLPRIKYQKYKIFERTPKREIKRGDIILINDQLERYKGELQIVLQDLKNDGRMNLVGEIPIEEHILLDYINKWDELIFIRKEKR